MFYLKLLITGIFSLTIYGSVTCSAENINKQLTPQQTSEQLNETLPVLVGNITNSRSARTLVPHSRTPSFTLRRRQPIQIRARADHFPIRTQIRRVHNNGLPSGQPQQQNMRLGYESLKTSKYLPNSKGANLPFPNNGKGSAHRPQLLAGHPNAIHVPALSQQYMHNFKASPAFNGQIKVHPLSQTQKQQTPLPNKENSYPKYVKPQQQPAIQSQTQTQKKPQQQNPSLMKYPDFQQHPIPDQEKMQHHNEQHEKYLQQQKFLTPKNPIAYYQQQQYQQQQHQELPAQLQQNYPVQQPPQYFPQSQQQQPSIPIHENAQAHNHINNVAFPSAASVPPKMYSVYEENDMTELQANNYQTTAYQALDKEAQEYLRFMNTDEYFLPKREPNYKRLDDDNDKRQLNILKAQAQQHLHSLQQSQASTPHRHHSLLPHQKPQHQQVYAPSASSHNSPYSSGLYSDASDASRYSQGNPVSRHFYEQDPATAASASASASSTVVRTSYQTGVNQNQFVVNSQDSKIGKYTIPPTSTTASMMMSTQSPLGYSQLRHNGMGNRTPEPLRFEFTERDAMVGGFPYTNSPQAQLRYKEILSNSVTSIVPNVESSTASSLKTQNYLSGKHSNVRPVVEDDEDDPEEGDDMQEAGNSIFGRQPVVDIDLKANTATSTTAAPPSEQKDTEDYCERICAIVEDDNEEIVCGSDGYMYTSEAQMECYASCLHIDVTIQGKGSCSTR